VNSGIHRLAVATTVVAFLVIVLGAWVRLSHAGLGCPDLLALVAQIALGGWTSANYSALACPDCGGRLRVAAPAHPCARGISASMHVIACIEDPPLIAKILGHVRSREAAATMQARAQKVPILFLLGIRRLHNRQQVIGIELRQVAGIDSVSLYGLGAGRRNAAGCHHIAMHAVGTQNALQAVADVRGLVT
jgi:heme A synthase